MKLRYWISMLMAMVLLCGCAGAEGAFSGPCYNSGMAVVGGEVYCAGPNVGLNFIPIWRVNMDGLEKVHSRIGGWNSLYAYGSELLTVEPVLNIVEMLGSIPTSTCRIRRFNPATGRARSFDTCVWDTESGVCNVFAAQGRAYRDVRDGDAHALQRLDDEEWVNVAAWNGDAAWVYQTFCVIGDRNADRPEYVALYEFSTGTIYDVTALKARKTLWASMEGVLEDGVLYRLEERRIAAVNLSTGGVETLVSLPEEMDSFILTDTQLILMSSTRQKAWVLNRGSWEVVSTVSMTEYPLCAALNDGKLYVYCIYAEAGVEIIDLTTGESMHYPL